MKDSARSGLIDHHCHGVVVEDLDRLGFESLMSEATGRSPWGTTLFDSAEGLALRRWCAPVLGLEPLATPESYLERRRELGAVEVTRRLLRSCGTDDFLVDTGYGPAAVTTPHQLAELAGTRAHEILRLETLAQDLLRSGIAPREVPERVRETLASTSAVGAKSIAAYRTGLALPSYQPSDDEVVRTLTAVPDDCRIANPTVHGWLAWAAIEAGLPLQFHVGYGDKDVTLNEADPLLLTPFLRASEERGVPVMLLHNYPFHRSASYLAQVFDHVFLDVGLATHNTGALSKHLLRETLELAPFGKLLYSSDAYGLPELHYLAATLFRRALTGLLSKLVHAAEATQADADHVESLVLSGNARRVYRLDLGSATTPPETP